MSGISERPPATGVTLLEWMRRGARRLLDLPEINVLFFAFVLFLPWELWLSAASLRSDGHGVPEEVAWMSTLASLGHAAVSVLAFWVVAGGTPAGRGWIRPPRPSSVLVFVLSALVFTVIGESAATGVLTGWEHAGSLPTLVAPGLGLASLLEVVAVPIATAWVVGRQLVGFGAGEPGSSVLTTLGSHAASGEVQ